MNRIKHPTDEQKQFVAEHLKQFKITVLAALSKDRNGTIDFIFDQCIQSLMNITDDEIDPDDALGAVTGVAILMACSEMLPQKTSESLIELAMAHIDELRMTLEARNKQ